jgi:hypothetical protein
MHQKFKYEDFNLVTLLDQLFPLSIVAKLAISQ